MIAMGNSRVISSQQQRGILCLFMTALLYYWICDEHYFKISSFNTTRLADDISFVEDMDLSTRIDCGKQNVLFLLFPIEIEVTWYRQTLLKIMIITIKQYRDKE